MANPLFGALGGSVQPQQNAFTGLVQQFKQFKQNFKGDPKEQVQELLNSGKMSQDQLNQCMSMARNLQNIFN